MATGDLTTLAAVKLWGSVPGSGGDAEIGALITAASQWITSYCSRPFTSQTFTEIRTGNGGSEMQLGNTPVTAISSLTVDGQPIPAQPADQQPGYFLVGECDGPLGANFGFTSVALFNYRFTKNSPRNVRISYTAGYSVVPVDVVQACNELVIAAYKRGVRGGPEVQNEAVGHQTFSFSLKDMPAAARAMLDNYRKVSPL